MTVSELIEKLKKYRQDAPIDVVAHCRSYPFSVSFWSSDGCTPATADVVSIYIDDLCTFEAANEKLTDGEQEKL